METRIPFLDLVTPHLELEEELDAVFREVVRTGRFIGGPMVEKFEQEFADFCDTRYSVGVGSGTDALRFALMAAGVRKGETVLTVPNTFIATTEAISQAGAVPAFIDVDEKTHNMDPNMLRRFLEKECRIDEGSGRPVHNRTGSKVTAVVPVHLYGQTAEMDPILEIARRYYLIVIEDACQAHGAEYFSEKEKAWKKAGSMGSAAAFSFYPGKNLGACGEAGAVTTNSQELAQKVRVLRDHGQTEKYYHQIEGYNGRLDALQAGILSIKLRRLAEANASRRRNAYHYNRLFGPVTAIKIPSESAWAKAVYHLYVIRTKRRDELRAYLSLHGIDTGLHYPQPLHLQKAYQAMGYGTGDFPAAEKAASEILSLPMFPQLRSDQQEETVSRVLEFFLRSVNESAAPEDVSKEFLLYAARLNHFQRQS